MAGANTAPAITVEVLVERNVIAPVRIILKGRTGAKDRPGAMLVPQKDQPVEKLLAELIKEP